MKSTQIPEEFQDCPQEPNEFLTFLNTLLKKINKQTKINITQAQQELYLELRRTVTAEFQRYSDIETIDHADLLSNVLLAMELTFQDTKEQQDSESSETADDVFSI